MYPPEWTEQAKCLGMNTEDWYPPRERGTYKLVGDRAKAVCKGSDGSMPCPVRLQCLAAAYERDEQFGIFGGLSHRERNALLRKAQVTGASWQEITLSDVERGLRFTRSLEYLRNLMGEAG